MNAQAKVGSGERPVLAAITKIMGEVGAVEKKGRNEFHKYEYAKAADIAHALQKRMAEAGLIIIPHQRKMELLCDGQLCAIEFEFWLKHVSGDQLEEHPVFTGMCRARDSKGGFDDKAANKCLTAASKYFVLHLFRIPTGDYPDADADAPPSGNGQRTPAPPAQSAIKPQEQTPEELEAYMVKQIEAQPDLSTLDGWAKRYGPAFKRLSPEAQARVKAATDKRRAALSQAPVEPHDPETGELPY